MINAIIIYFIILIIVIIFTIVAYNNNNLILAIIGIIADIIVLLPFIGIAFIIVMNKILGGS